MELQGYTQAPRASEAQILRHSRGLWAIVPAAFAYIALIVQISALAASGAGGALLSVLIVAYAGLAVVVSGLILASDRRMLREALSFRRFYPFQAFGYLDSDFQHVFASSNANILREVMEKMDRDLTANLGWDSYQVFKLKDDDRRLIQPDVRSFVGWRGGKSKRGGSVHLLARASQKGNICSLHWWLMVSGVIDAGRVRGFLAWAPFTLPFWIVPWLRGRHNVAVGLRQPYGSFYEAMDVSTSAKSARKICMDALINILKSHNIDTSELSRQAYTVVNNQMISSSGNLAIGNLVQGMRNSVSGGDGAPKGGERV